MQSSRLISQWMPVEWRRSDQVVIIIIHFICRALFESSKTLYIEEQINIKRIKHNRIKFSSET